MLISELFFEATQTQQLVVVYPGRFQPFHRGHKEVYDHLCKRYGHANVWIASSNKVDPPRSPFNFKEKLAMMQLTGVSADRVVQSTQPYRAEELLGSWDPTQTRVIFAVSAKDMAEDPRFRFGVKRDGTATYYQPMPQRPQDMVTMDQHGYIDVVPTFEFKILGQPMQSASDLRAMFAAADEPTQKLIVKQLFGAYDPTIYDIMREKITEQAAVGVVATTAAQASDPRYASSMTQDVNIRTPQQNLKALKLT